MSTEQIFTLAQAAEACNVSLSTIRRKRDDLQRYGATRDNKGWKIPASALISAGLPLDKVAADDSPDDRLAVAPEIAVLTALVQQLQEDLARERQRCDIAEDRATRAEERLDRLIESGAKKPGFWARIFRQNSPENGDS